jgi:hypothetical protein
MNGLNGLNGLNGGLRVTGAGPDALSQVVAMTPQRSGGCPRYFPSEARIC